MSKVDPKEHAGRVSGMFGRIAGWYDFLNHFLSLGQDIIWRKKLVASVKPGTKGVFLDLAAGTMDVTRELLGKYKQSDVVAVDFSRPMLEKGRTKVSLGKYRTQAIEADGRKIPLADESVDAVTIAFGIRNIKPREEAYAEIMRVLAPGGRLAILEFGSSKRPIMKGLYNFYLNTLLPGVGKLVSGDSEAYRYLAETIGEFPTPEDLEGELENNGFVNVTHESLTYGIVNIHVAEKRLFTGDTFVLGGKEKAEPAPEPKPKKIAAQRTVTLAEKAKEEAPAPPEKGEGAAQGASNLSAAMSAFEKAEKEQPKPKKKAAAKKAPAKKAAPKKAAAKKTTAKKAAPKKAAEKTAAKKVAPKKTAAKKSEAKAEEKDADPKKKAAPKKKAPAKKAAAKKTTAKKAAPKKKAAAKKTTKKKAAPKKSDK